MLTRCSEDISAVDGEIGNLLLHCTRLALEIFLTALTVVVVAGWIMLLPSIALIQAGLFVGRVYMSAQLPIKRMMSNAKAPVMSQIQTALAGLSTTQFPLWNWCLLHTFSLRTCLWYTERFGEGVASPNGPIQYNRSFVLGSK